MTDRIATFYIVPQGEISVIDRTMDLPFTVEARDVAVYGPGVVILGYHEGVTEAMAHALDAAGYAPLPLDVTDPADEQPEEATRYDEPESLPLGLDAERAYLDPLF